MVRRACKYNTNPPNTPAAAEAPNAGGEPNAGLAPNEEPPEPKEGGLPKAGAAPNAKNEEKTACINSNARKTQE